MKKILLSFLALFIVTSCSPTGTAAGIGAALGISAAKEGGIKTTASDAKISANIKDKWFKYDLETFSKLNF